ncbi:hypothetical protein GVN20_05570 [Runella sp. CRIBMP]|uniref:winged helix-turn-helix domain-containing protein n=1 Tax=Runella sp. CRIBMP TaxID=2683261 RepID=UPI0014129A52|nr:helix-turn-helix domain-containing protein [Runella sp. CRIBMP]NBB18818.1 hypothetical protein [Runella sp. CRIBMP]
MDIKPQINYHDAVTLWCRRVDEYNEQCPVVEKKTTRHLPNGTVEEVSTFRKVGTIKGSVKTTGMHLIRRYVEAWAAANLTTKEIPSPADVYISTNRVELAERLSRSHRSVYDHIRKLRQVGLVDNYQFCGRHNDFKVWISPEILFGGVERAKSKPAQKAQKTALKSSVRQNLPPLDISLKQQSTTISKVDCGQTPKQNHGDNKDPHNPAFEGNAPTKQALWATETRGGGRGAAEYEKLFKSFNRLPKALKEIVLNLWLVIRTSLYSRHEWSNEENHMAVLELYDHLFGRFTTTQSEKAWKDYAVELSERVEMAKAWFDKNAQRHPDYPFQRGKKMGYFDPKNNFGFAVTALWLAKDKLRKRQNRVEYLLNQARIDFEKLAAGKPRPKVMEKNELQLFVYYQNWAKTYGKEVEERFCQQYLSQKARKFAPARPQRLTIRAQKAADKAAQVVYVEPWMEMGEYY